MEEILIAAVIGLAAGVVAGLLGVGGGILFVPALAIVLDEPQLRAEATSLLAIIPVGLVGVWRQRRYGNVRIAEGLWIGGLSVIGVTAGVLVANAVPERALELGFAGLILFVAFQLARKALRDGPPVAAPEPLDGQTGVTHR